MAVGPLQFTPLSQDDPLHAALAKIGELYSATNFLTWWDARAFSVGGKDVEDWDPGEREHMPLLAAFVEAEVLPGYATGTTLRFSEHVARIGPVSWEDVRQALLDALKHHPVAGGVLPGSAAGQFSPHAFMLLEVLEQQVAAALDMGSGTELGIAERTNLRCAVLRPREDSVFQGSLYQHLFVVWSPGSCKLLWFDLGGSQ